MLRRKKQLGYFFKKVGLHLIVLWSGKLEARWTELVAKGEVSG